VTYVIENTANAAALTQSAAPAKTGPGFWSRLFAAMVESRRRSALRELRAYSYRLKDAELGLYAAKCEAELPFRG
jgi:hypothetical protein